MPKLSEINPAEIQSAPIKLSQIDPAHLQPMPAKGEDTYQSPGESPSNSYAANVGARLTDPERYKAILGMDSPAKMHVTEGVAPMAIPASGAPGALLKAADFIAASAPRRIAANTALGAVQGAVQTPGEGETRGGNALRGGGIALGLSGLGETVGALTSPASRIHENLYAQKDPEAFANLARDRIADTRQGLVNSTEENAGKLEDLLRGKQIPVSGTEMEGNELNDLKKSYDAQARRPKGAMWSTGEAAKAEEAGAQANQARAAIEAAVPEAKDLNSEMQREIKLRSYLKSGADRAPIATLTSPSADKQALLEEASRRGGTDLAKFGSDSRLAKSLTFRPSDLSHMGMGTMVKAGGRLGLEALNAADYPARVLKDPVALSALLSSLQDKK